MNPGATRETPAFAGSPDAPSERGRKSHPDHLLAELVRWAAVVREVIRAPNGMAALAAVLRYIYETNERVTVEEIKVLVAAMVGKEAENEIMTLAERLRQEGREDGLTTGLTTGRLTEARSALWRVLTRRGLTNRPEDQERIESCTDLAALERWLDQAITAKNIAEALA